MKNIILSTLLIISTLSVLSQQQATVIDSKSVIVPRYADLTAIQAAIPSPEAGMTVYNNATNTFWYYSFPIWVELLPSQWKSNGSNIHFSTGNVGIGTSTPTASLQFNPVVGARKIAFSNSINDNQFDGFGTRLTGSGSEIAYNVFSAASSAHTFYSGIDANNVKELLRIKGNGEVSLGLGPNARLKFAEQAYSRKIILVQSSSVNNDHQFYGFGVNSNSGETSVRYQVSVPSDAHIFYSGSSSSSSLELFKIKGDGNVGVNHSTPKSKFEINGALATTVNMVNADIILDNSASVYYFQDGFKTTLPDPSLCANRRYVLANVSIKNIDLLAYLIYTLDGNTINILQPHSSIEIISDGTNWLQIK